MIRRHTRFTRTGQPFPYTTLFRSRRGALAISSARNQACKASHALRLGIANHAIDGIGGVVSQEVNAVASDADVVGKADDRHPCPAFDGRDGANIVGTQRPETELVAIADRLLLSSRDSAFGVIGGDPPLLRLGIEPGQRRFIWDSVSN